MVYLFRLLWLLVWVVSTLHPCGYQTSNFKLIRSKFEKWIFLESKMEYVWEREYLILRKWFLNGFDIVRKCRVCSFRYVSCLRLSSIDFFWGFSGLEVSHSPTFTLELCFQYLGWETCKLFYVDFYRFFFKLAMLIELGRL